MPANQRCPLLEAAPHIAMESRSSLRQLHQQIGNSSHSRYPTATNHRLNVLSWQQVDQRIAPPLPSLPPWAAESNSNQTRENRRESAKAVNDAFGGKLSPHGGWRRPPSYLKQLPARVSTDEQQKSREKDEARAKAQRQTVENQQMEAELASPGRFAMVKTLSEVRSSINNTTNTPLCDDDREEPTSSGSSNETNQQDERSPERFSPLRGQFFRSWKKEFTSVDDVSSSGRRWSPLASNKWKERALMDPFAKRRARVMSFQPPPLSAPHCELPRVQSPVPRPIRGVSAPSQASNPSTLSISTSPRPKAPEHLPLNPLRLSSADKRRAATLHRTIISPSSPGHSVRSTVSRDVSHDSLSCFEERHVDMEKKQEAVGFAALRREQGSKKAGNAKNPKKSTVDALNEIKRKREARRALQAQEKRRVEKELREHGDDAGYKFRRLIQQYRDALPSCQQQQHREQLPPLLLSASIRPPPTPTRFMKAADAPRLSVFIRKRPLAKKELKIKGYDILSCLFASEAQSDRRLMLLRRELVCHEPKLRVDCTETLENHYFRFDGVFDEWQENNKVYDATVGPMVPSLVKGASVPSDTISLTVFAYGQTGSGKTYTMKSIYRQVALDLFQQLDEVQQATDARVMVGVSFYEIYMNTVNDLLNGQARVQLMEDGDGAVQLPGLKELPATTSDDLLELVQLGEQARATSANAVHDDSSRSHALLRVTLYANDGLTMARLFMVDLAGSERASDTQSDKKSTRMEGAEINKSLLALKECIRALDRGATHIPFRQSKLTQLLRDSFLSRNSKTIMIATVSPCSESCNHTLNTLRYADRLKEIGSTSSL